MVDKRCHVHTQPPLWGVLLSNAVSWAVKTELASLPRKHGRVMPAPGPPRRGSPVPPLRCRSRDGSSQSPFSREPPVIAMRPPPPPGPLCSSDPRVPAQQAQLQEAHPGQEWPVPAPTVPQPCCVPVVAAALTGHAELRLQPRAAVAP